MIGKCEKMKNSEKWIAKNRKGSLLCENISLKRKGEKFIHKGKRN